MMLGRIAPHHLPKTVCEDGIECGVVLGFNVQAAKICGFANKCGNIVVIPFAKDGQQSSCYVCSSVIQEVY